MIELVYVSRAAFRFEQKQLEELLTHARLFNETQDITGLLLYDGYGTFIQALEGPDDHVDALFKKIKADKRHSNVNKIGYSHITERTFPDWKMGFKLLQTSQIHDLPGFSQFMNSRERPEYIQSHQSFALDMLRYFRDSK